MTSAACHLLCGLSVQGSLSACVAAASAYPFLVTFEHSGGAYTLSSRNGWAAAKASPGFRCRFASTPAIPLDPSYPATGKR